MNRNIELKTRFGDLERAKDVLAQMGAREQKAMGQADTYFFCVKGRLKLREVRTESGSRAELIWYEREDAGRTRGSDYTVVRVEDAEGLKAALGAGIGVRGVVKKRREWWLWKNVRVHLDSVEGLGTFVEFEAVLSEGESEEEGHARIQELCRKLGIEERDYLERSYADLMGI